MQIINEMDQFHSVDTGWQNFHSGMNFETSIAAFKHTINISPIQNSNGKPRLKSPRGLGGNRPPYIQSVRSHLTNIITTEAAKTKLSLLTLTTPCQFFCLDYHKKTRSSFLLDITLVIMLFRKLEICNFNARYYFLFS